MGRVIGTTTVTFATAGGAGTSTGSGSTPPLTGELLDIYLDFGQAAATTDTTVSETAFGNILVVTDSCTDARYAPRMVTHSPAAAALTWYDRYPLSDSVITVSCAQANVAATGMTATIRWLTTF